MRHAVNWVVKTSKLCNLRCLYCYEWNELSNPKRMTLDEWRRLLLCIRRHHERRSDELGAPIQSHVVWHGGEPLLLPVEYMEAVLRLQREVFGDAAVRRREIVNALQTNLYSLSDETIAFLKRSDIALGVSMDVAGGVRLDRAGGETESRVARNMDRLSKARIAFGAIVVLARHTAEKIVDVYEFYRQLGVGLRVLPLFDTPTLAQGAAFAASREEIVESLQRLFVHWMGVGPGRTDVSPLHEYLETILLCMMGRSRGIYDRRVAGDYAILVDTDGSLYTRADAYDRGRALGNAFTQSIDEILGSRRYVESVEREEAIAQTHCSNCEYQGPCDRTPIFESPGRAASGGHCTIAYPLYRFMEAHVRSAGYGASDLNAILTSYRRSPH